MGRDDARAVGVLQGGRAPARAFADYMKVAVAKRPVEQFETQVTLPEWQLEPDEEAYYGQPAGGTDGGMMVDENGLPIERGQQQPDADSPPDDSGQPPHKPAARPQPPRLDPPRTDNVLGPNRPPTPTQHKALTNIKRTR